MALEHNSFLNHLCESMAELLNGVVAERSFPFLRSTPQVVLTTPSDKSPDLHLCVIERALVEDDKGSFNCALPPDRYLVFRNPVEMRVSFQLVGMGLNRMQSLGAYDRLTSFFFDNRSIEPFLPTSYAKYSSLFEKLKSRKAELKFRGQEKNFDPRQNFSFGFDYLALYHSGNPMREEQRVKTRVIEMNDNYERNAL